MTPEERELLHALADLYYLGYADSRGRVGVAAKYLRIANDRGEKQAETSREVESTKVVLERLRMKVNEAIRSQREGGDEEPYIYGPDLLDAINEELEKL